MSCTEAGLTLAGPDLLDYTVNGRPLRRAGMPSSNRSHAPAMAPHGIYPASEPDRWVAIACRDDDDWRRLAVAIGEPWAQEPRWQSLQGRLNDQDELDESMMQWTAARSRDESVSMIRAAEVPVAPVALPDERIERDPGTSEWGLWPVAHHPEIGDVRVDGEPLHLSETDWVIERGAPQLGEHNDYVFGELLGHSSEELDQLRAERVI
jgi:crotonobetainyl-CoA:carnitine CoA-transferase CaiB-like acyl-CoA transferase